MRYFTVHYTFRPGINGAPENREHESAFDDIDPETTDNELKNMAVREVENRFYNSIDYPLYGKFWQIIEVEERCY